MVDVFPKERRSYVMSRIRSHGNASTELRLIAVFKELGISGWRRNYPLFGKPDFVFQSEKVAVFVDGVFWHGHPRLPSGRRDAGPSEPTSGQDGLPVSGSETSTALSESPSGSFSTIPPQYQRGNRRCFYA